MKHMADEIAYLAYSDRIILAGGSMRSMLDPAEAIVDYDCFFREDQHPTQVAEFLLDLGYEVTFKCPEGLLTTLVHKPSETKVQLITERTWRDGDELIDSFDIIAGCAYATSRGELVCHPGFPAAVDRQTISFHRITYPVATLLRVRKYLAKGYSFNSDAARWLVRQIGSRMWEEENLRGYID